MSDESTNASVSKAQIEATPAQLASNGSLADGPLFAGVPSMPDYFMGREALLRAVLDRLYNGHDVALSSGGIPGVGATALALAIAHHPSLHGHFPDGVLWASCSDEQDAGACLSQWATVLGIDISTCPDESTVSRVLRDHLGDRRILLVIDSPGYDEVVLLRCGGPHCVHLVTTSDEMLAREFAAPEDVFGVPPLAGDVTRALLWARAPMVAQAEQQLLEQVAVLTGGIPLVIHLLGAYLAAPETSAVENLIAPQRVAGESPATELTPARRRLLLAQQRLSGGNPSPATVQRAIALCVAALPSPALHAFRCLGAFATAPHTFNRAAAEAVCQCDEQTLDLLVARHLLEVLALDPASTAGHAPLRQRTHAERATGRAPDRQARLFIRKSISGIALVRADPLAVSRHRDYYLALARKCREVGANVDADYGQIRHACASTPDGPPVMEFLWAMQHYQARHNLQREQASWARRAQLPGSLASSFIPTLTATAKSGLSTDAGPMTQATLLEQIGATYDAMGQPQQAIGYYRRALNLHELYPDPSNSFGLGHTLHRLGMAHERLNQREQAVALFESALPALDRADARDYAGAAHVYASLGSLYNEMGRHVQAVDTLQRALDVYDDPANVQHGDTAGLVDTLGQMGKACMQLGRYAQARTHLQRALEYRERAMPADQAGLAMTLCELGECCTAQGQQNIALDSLRRALSIYEKAPDGTVGMARTLNALGALLHTMNKPDQAIVTYLRALPMCEALGDQELIAQCCMGLGLVMNSKSRREDALIYLQRALAILSPPEQKDAAPPVRSAQQNTRLAAVLNHVAAQYLDRNEPSRALEYLQQSLEIREGNLPGDQAGLAQTLNNLGSAYTKLNQPEKAMQCLNRTLLIYSQLGDGAGESAARCNLALLHMLLGQYDQAVISMRRTVELDREINSPDLASHQALLTRVESEEANQSRSHPDGKSSLFGRLRKR